MTERLRILIHISNYFETLEILEKKLSDMNEPNTLLLHEAHLHTPQTKIKSEVRARGKLNGANLVFFSRGIESLACSNRGDGRNIHRVDDGCSWLNWEDRGGEG